MTASNTGIEGRGAAFREAGGRIKREGRAISVRVAPNGVYFTTRADNPVGEGDIVIANVSSDGTVNYVNQKGR